MAQFGACSGCIANVTVSPNWLTSGVLAMETFRPASTQRGSGKRRGNGNGNGHEPGNGHGHGGSPGAASPQSVGKLTLVEAAQIIERLEGRAAHERELEALRIARDALLVIVSEGFSTLGDRLRADVQPAHAHVHAPVSEPVRESGREPEPVAAALSGGPTASPSLPSYSGGRGQPTERASVKGLASYDLRLLESVEL